MCYTISPVTRRLISNRKGVFIFLSDGKLITRDRQKKHVPGKGINPKFEVERTKIDFSVDSLPLFNTTPLFPLFTQGTLHSPFTYFAL